LVASLNQTGSSREFSERTSVPPDGSTGGKKKRIELTEACCQLLEGFWAGSGGPRKENPEQDGRLRKKNAGFTWGSKICRRGETARVGGRGDGEGYFRAELGERRVEGGGAASNRGGERYLKKGKGRRYFGSHWG